MRELIQNQYKQVQQPVNFYTLPAFSQPTTHLTHTTPHATPNFSHQPKIYLQRGASTSTHTLGHAAAYSTTGREVAPWILQVGKSHPGYYRYGGSTLDTTGNESHTGYHR